MPRYRYKARTLQGKAVEAELDAVSDDSLEQELARNGLVLVSAQPLGAKGKRARAAGRALRLSNRDLTLFTMELSTSYKAGLPLLSTLDDMAASAETPAVRAICAGVADRVRGGSSLLDAMQAYPRAFPPLYTELVGAAERTGQLDTVLDDLVRFLDWQKEIQGQIASATIYPASLIGVVILVIVILMGFVFPKFLEQFAQMGIELPFATQALIDISAFFNQNGTALAAAAVIIPVVFLLVRNQPAVRWRLDTMKLKLPLFGPLLTKVLMSRLAHNLGMMLASGLEFSAALAISERLMGNVVLAKLVADTKAAIEQGMPLSDAMARGGHIPSLVRRMLKLGESTGKLDETLEHVSHYYDKEVPAALSKMFAMLQPAILVVMAGVVLFMAAAVFGPIYQMIDAVQE